MQDDARDDVDFQPDEEAGDIAAADARVKKLKIELDRVKKERQEYLDGWQRCRADAVNAKQENARTAQRSAEMLREALVHDIIPVLDSFDMAAGSESWAEVNDGFRSGMEAVRGQLIAALESHGVRRYGKVGEMFDPALHEVAQEMDEAAGAAGSVVKILRHGYRSAERILRPAHVILKK